MNALKTIRLGELDMAYRDEGAGLPLLLVHGFPLDHSMWSEQFRALSGDFRVIAPDLRGFGSSSVPAGAVTMERLADDLAQLLDALQIDEPIFLCGLSMGGYVAWQFWKNHADRLRGLILCDTRAAGDTPEAAETRRKTAEKTRIHGASIVAEGMLPKLFSQHTRQHQPERVEAVRQVMEHTSPLGIIAALEAMATRPDMRAELPHVTVPSLVICGDDDAITPLTEMREMAQQMPNAEWLAVPDAGHMAPLENPDVVNEAIARFARQVMAA